MGDGSLRYSGMQWWRVLHGQQSTVQHADADKQLWIPLSTKIQGQVQRCHAVMHFAECTFLPCANLLPCVLCIRGLWSIEVTDKILMMMTTDILGEYQEADSCSCLMESTQKVYPLNRQSCGQWWRWLGTKLGLSIQDLSSNCQNGEEFSIISYFKEKIGGKRLKKSTAAWWWAGPC